jgi:heme/copper-type cytochrome/quinol oxidase subunit 3
MEASASAPTAPHIEPEPREWQPRALWVGGRMFCGAASFFFVSFLFAYFYLRSIDSNHSWKIGSVHPSMGLGVAVAGLFLLSAIVFRLGALRPTDTLGAGIAALLLALLAVALQCVEYTTLKFGPASGGYASVFVGWTSLYAVCALGGIYWMETQVASVWRVQREGHADRALREGVPADEDDLLRAGIEACSFFWAYFVAMGVIAYIVLYVV